MKHMRCSHIKCSTSYIYSRKDLFFGDVNCANVVEISFCNAFKLRIIMLFIMTSGELLIVSQSL